MNSENLVGRRFGHLTVIKLNNQNHLGNSWLCKCDCGNEIILRTSHLLGNKTRNPNKSCGCSQKTLNGKSLEHPRIYRIWKHMIYRCYRTAETGYERYGGKGVTVCQEWIDSFDSFLEWALSNGYSDTLTIDRIDSTKPYQPDNCRWATYFTQEQNRGLMGNNTSGYNGISQMKNGRYRAYIQRMGVRKHIGSFKTKEEAVIARDRVLEQYEMTGTL